MKLVCLAIILGLSLASELEGLNVQSANNTVKVNLEGRIEFSHWSWVYALIWILIVVCVRSYFRGIAFDQLHNIDLSEEFRNRDGAYRIEDFKADKEIGALQTCKKDEDGWIQLKLSKRTKVTHDTYSFQFEFPNKNMEFGLPIGCHVFFYATVFNPEKGKEEEIARKYTPTSSLHQKRFCEFIIKIYRKDENPRFPHGGMMTQYLEKLPIGQYLKMEGPKGRLEYNGRGNFYIDKHYLIRKNIGMVAGGTGITPIFQIIQAVVKNKDRVHMTLLFANKSEKDILIREELEQMQEDYPERFTLRYIIDKADHPETWKYDTGYVTQEILKKYMPLVDKDVIILTCGPKVMNELVVQNLPNHHVFEF